MNNKFILMGSLLDKAGTPKLVSLNGINHFLFFISVKETDENLIEFPIYIVDEELADTLQKNFMKDKVVSVSGHFSMRPYGDKKIIYQIADTITYIRN